MTDSTLGVFNTADMRELARKRMPRGLFEYMDRGSEDEVSVANNRSSLEAIRFRPRLLHDVSARNQRIELFGKPCDMPVVIGPTGFGGLCAYEGEIHLARAAAKAGIPYVVGAASLTRMERIIAEGGGGRLWFQIHLWPEREFTQVLAERAEQTGVEAMVVTIDGPVAANREFNQRNGFTIPFNVNLRTVPRLFHLRWLLGVILPYLIHQGGMPRHDNYPRELQRKVTAAPTAKGRTRAKIDSLTWDDLRAFRKVWKRPLIVKGILGAADAQRAVECGADGLVISNHGGRNLDGAICPIEVLEEVAGKVGHRTVVMIDSGFRRGSDVVKALAMGAKAVLLGRAPLYGLTAAGEAGVTRSLAIFRDEIERVMALLGCSSVAELTIDLLALPGAARQPA